MPILSNLFWLTIAKTVNNNLCLANIVAYPP